MAIYTQNEYTKCKCGCEIFTEVETFRILKKPVKSTLTDTISVEKEILGKQMQCTVCGTLMPNPLTK